MIMARSIRRTLKRMGMDNGSTMLDMDVHKQGDAAVIPNKEYQQQPFHIFRHCLFHAVPCSIRAQRYNKDLISANGISNQSIDTTRYLQLLWPTNDP